MMTTINLLSETEKSQVHDCTIDLLLNVGMHVGKKEIRDLLIENGASETANERVLFTKEMVEKALSECPKSFSVFGNDETEYRIGGGARPLVSTCMVDPYMNTPEGNRPPVLEDCARNARIINGEPLIDVPYKMDITYSGISEKECVSQSNYAMMANMSKPFIHGPQTKRDLEITLEMAQIMAPGLLADKPNILVMLSPSSPLALHHDCLEMLELAIHYRVPIICLPCPMNGLTSPVSVAGTVLGINAENLALITVIQLLNPGNKTIYHTVGMPADPKTLEARMTGPEKMLDTMAAAEMGRYYGFPVGLPVSSTDVSCFDIQNGAESMSQIFPGVLFSPDIMTGVGSNSNACGTSIEQILLDCEMIRLAERFKRGVNLESINKGFELLKRIAYGGTFITDGENLEDFVNEDIFCPELFSWSGHKDDKLCAVDKARLKAERLAAMPINVNKEKLDLLRKYMSENGQG